MKWWLIEFLTGEDEEDRKAREEANTKLDSGQIQLDYLAEKVDKIADDAKDFRARNRQNHYKESLALSYEGRRR